MGLIFCLLFYSFDLMRTLCCSRILYIAINIKLCSYYSMCTTVRVYRILEYSSRDVKYSLVQ